MSLLPSAFHAEGWSRKGFRNGTGMRPEGPQRLITKDFTKNGPDRGGAFLRHPSAIFEGGSQCMEFQADPHLCCGSWNWQAAIGSNSKSQVCKAAKIDGAVGWCCHPPFFRRQGRPGRCRSGDGAGHG